MRNWSRWGGGKNYICSSLNKDHSAFILQIKPQKGKLKRIFRKMWTCSECEIASKPLGVNFQRTLKWMFKYNLYIRQFWQEEESWDWEIPFLRLTYIIINKFCLCSCFTRGEADKMLELYHDLHEFHVNWKILSWACRFYIFTNPYFLFQFIKHLFGDHDGVHKDCSTRKQEGHLCNEVFETTENGKMNHDVLVIPLRVTWTQSRSGKTDLTFCSLCKVIRRWILNQRRFHNTLVKITGGFEIWGAVYHKFYCTCLSKSCCSSLLLGIMPSYK